MAKDLVLKLTGDEAETLQYILEKIGGCPTDSPRKHADSIGEKLDKMEFRKTFKLNSNGSIFFEEYEKKVCGSCKRPL